MTAFLWALYGVRTIQREGRKQYVLSFIALCIGVTIWSACHSVQLASPTLERKLLAYKLLHVGAVVAPPAWFAFAVTYSGREEWLSKATIAGLVTIPLALLLAFPTNPDSLVLTSVRLKRYGSLTVLVADHGPLYLLQLAYSYVLILTGVLLIVRYAINSTVSVRRQSVLLVTGAIVPLVLNVFDVLRIPPFGDLVVNRTPVSLSLSAVLFGVAIFRYHVLDVIPVAFSTRSTGSGFGLAIVRDIADAHG